jgi:hypothetical protein
LLGIKDAARDEGGRLGKFFDAVNADLDMTIKFPTRLLVSRVPFERWYPKKGPDRDKHIAEAKERLGHGS